MIYLLPLLASAFALQVPGTIDVPFRIGENAIIADAMINGHKVSLMFDTGFGGSVVVDNTLDLGTPTGTQTLRDFVGEIEMPVVKMKSFRLGEKKIDVADLPEAVLAPPERYSFAYNTHVDGIMGFSVIKDTVTGINFEKHKFVFYPKSFDITKLVPDNKKTFLVKLLPIGGNSLELAVDTPSGKKLTMALDTGNAFYATTHRDVLERVGLWEPSKEAKYMRQSGIASGPVDSWSLKMPTLKIFGVPVTDSVWDIIDLPAGSAEMDGTVGYGFLHNFNIIIDLERRRVWLENFTGKVADDAIGDVGISAGRDTRDNTTRIARVAPDSPADKAGIKVDDRILSIDDTDTLGTESRRIRRMLEGTVGSKVVVTISHKGEVKRLTLERRPLYNEAAAAK